MEFLDSYLACVYLLSLVLIGFATKETTYKSIYYMTRDCKLPKQNFDNMENNRRELTIPLGGAIIYSHQKDETFPVDFVCMIVAHAAEGHRIHVNIKNLYIPTKSDICTNAMYLYDSNTYLTKGMNDAGGDSGMCNKVPSKTLTTSKSYLTIVLRTDNTICNDCSLEEKPGVKLILTSIQDAKKDPSSSRGRKCPLEKYFLCHGDRDPFCISPSLKCDGIPNCNDGSDEDESKATCGKHGKNLFNKIFSLGVSAAIAIVAGPILCFVVCLAGTVCCCFRCSRASQKNSTSTTPSGGTARTIPPSSTGLGSIPGSANGDSVYVGGNFLPMHSVSGGATSVGGSDRTDPAFQATQKYSYSVNGHCSTSSAGTASPFNYKKNIAPSLTSSGYQALIYSGGCVSKSYSGVSGCVPGNAESSLVHGHPIGHPAATGRNGGYPSSVYSYQSSHSSAGATGHALPTYRDSLLSSSGGGRLHSPTSSRSGRSLRSSVTYHAYNPTPSLANNEERIEYPVQL